MSALPGIPDVVFLKPKVAVFCDGDFWHGKDWGFRRQKLRRGANADYWVEKIRRNMERDRLHSSQLEEQGWTVLRFWESEILSDPLAVVQTIRQTLEERAPRRRPAGSPGASPGS